MKLGEIKQILEKNIPELHYKQINAVGSQPAQSDMIGLLSYCNAVIEIERIGLFAGLISELRNSYIFTTNNDKARIVVQEANRTKILTNNFLVVVNSFLESIDKILPNENDKSIYVKLTKIDSLKQLSTYIEELDKAFSQIIVNETIKGQVKLQGVENGSVWLNIFLGTSAAVSLIASAAWSGAVIYKKIQEGKMFEEQAKTLKLKRESVDDLKEAQKKQLTTLVQAESESIFSEHFGDTDKEQVERLKYSIKIIANLIQSGAEIHPALSTPEDVKNLFPDMKLLNQIESKIKKIAN